MSEGVTDHPAGADGAGSGGTAAGADDAGPDEPADVGDAIDELEARGEAIRREQLERALARLDGESGLTDGQREAVERLSERLVDRLLSVPRARLREIAADGDQEAVETAVALFEFPDPD